MYKIFEALLAERGVTAYQVAKATGISTGSLSDWKNGRSSPKVEKLKKIADYFGVSVDYLLGNEEKPAVKSDALKNDSKLFQRIGNPLENGIVEISNITVKDNGKNKKISFEFSIDETGLSAEELDAIAALLKETVSTLPEAIDKFSTLPFEGEVSDDELKHALLNGAPATDSQLDEVKRFAKYIADNGPLSKD